MKKEAVNAIFARLAEANPAPRTELAFTNHYTLLVAVVLSAQATDVGVNKATPALFAVADTPAKMLALGEDGLKRHIKTIGLFNSKAKHIIALSRALVERHGGTVRVESKLGQGTRFSIVWPREFPVPKKDSLHLQTAN